MKTPVDFGPVDMASRESPGSALLSFLDQGLPANETILVEVHQAVQAHFKWRILLLINQSFFAAVEIDVNQQQARFNARYVQRQHARGLDLERPPAINQDVPDPQCLVRIHPDFIAKVPRVSGARNLYLHAGDRAPGNAKA